MMENRLALTFLYAKFSWHLILQMHKNKCNPLHSASTVMQYLKVRLSYSLENKPASEQREEKSSILTLNITLLEQNKSNNFFSLHILLGGIRKNSKGVFHYSWSLKKENEQEISHCEYSCQSEKGNKVQIGKVQVRYTDLSEKNRIINRRTKPNAEWTAKSVRYCGFNTLKELKVRKISLI